jgi:1,4-alpha-glucan branching enzyme
MISNEASDFDLYLFHEGRHFHSYRFMGAQIQQVGNRDGVRFTVWAPNAAAVQVVGDFNGWQGEQHRLKRISQSGIWTLFIPDIDKGALYKYEIQTADGRLVSKADPYAFAAELRPGTASQVTDIGGYLWGDDTWRQQEGSVSYQSPLVIYEVHAGSWQRNSDGSFLTYRQLAEVLVPYVKDMGYTHIELLPLAEHPLDASWGYQATGYYAATSRYGSPTDLMYLIDCCHQQGIGVIMDWVPGHFCKDDHGLRQFDGTALYEHWQTDRAENYGWGTLNFDYSTPEIRSFLISNALFWLNEYHVDGLRVDAVASMLYLDYGKESGQWSPNQYGGRENIEAIALIRQLNEAIFAEFPQALVMAEESTAWPLVTKPTYVGGLGFNYKWNMGWMNDTLRYMSLDPIHRQWEHHLLTFSLMYAFSENFVLPLSHDEVVHGKKSLVDKMPGDYWQKFANLRAFYGYWMAHPGKKLLFMGGEFGQFIEWNEAQSLDWHLLGYELHGKLKGYVQNLNHLYRQQTALWQLDHDWQGFQWIDCHDYSQSVISFLRTDDQGNFIIVIANFTPIVRYNYRIGVPKAGRYREIMNSDAECYGGSGQINGELLAQPKEWHSQPCSLELKLPPLASIYLQWEAEGASD